MIYSFEQFELDLDRVELRADGVVQSLEPQVFALLTLLVENREALIEAVNSDYGCRSRFETIFSELLINQDGILDTIKQLKKWMPRHLRR